MTSRALYPEIEPYESGRIRVDGIHDIYYEQSGNPNGKPALFIHGGPGAGSDPKHRRFWDPAAYRIVLFDQRGAGNSTPHGSLEKNTTWDLVRDIEALRGHLHIDRWQVFGGSWGSTLALAYAQRAPSCVTELILRGIFLLRDWEIRWFYQEGASRIFPDAWEGFVGAIPEGERDDLVRAYHRRLTCEDAAARAHAALAWSSWEGSTSTLRTDPVLIARASQPAFAEALARIECHYFVHRGFLEHDGALLDEIDRIRHIPAVIVQGRYDVVCPMDSAWTLHRAWPEAELRVVADAGHAASEPGITSELVAATDGFRGKDARPQP